MKRKRERWMKKGRGDGGLVGPGGIAEVGGWGLGGWEMGQKRPALLPRGAKEKACSFN